MVSMATYNAIQKNGVFGDSNEQFGSHEKLSPTSAINVNCMKHDPINLIYVIIGTSNSYLHCINLVYGDSNEQFGSHEKKSRTSTINVNCMKHDPIDLIYVIIGTSNSHLHCINLVYHFIYHRYA